jgi:hypothetical protein
MRFRLKTTPHPWTHGQRRGSTESIGEIIADNLSKAGWSWGCVSAVDSQGQTIWIVDAHRGDGKRFVLRAEEKLTAFLELELAISRANGWLQRR